MLMLLKAVHNTRHFVRAQSSAAVKFMLCNIAHTPALTQSSLNLTPACCVESGLRHQSGLLRASQPSWLLPGRSFAGYQSLQSGQTECTQLSGPCRATTLHRQPICCVDRRNAARTSRPVQRSMQSVPAANTEAEQAQRQRARQQAVADDKQILPAADTATSPFLCHSSAHLDRARVDYSQAQRPLHVVDPEVEMINPADWDIICDVRTPDEFAEDHLIGAINTPVLSNEQRAQVGTLYKQTGQHEAKRLGAALISQNISEILLSKFQGYGKNLKVLVYCWRGGERSQSLAHVLSRVGWEVAVVKRGYMGYRNQVRRCMEVLGRFQYHVIGGATGSGKGKLLDCLADQHGQVVDLEVAADHRGSILGDHPTRLQPPQKMFESKLLHQMRNFSVERPVFIESESSLVGRRQVPAAMWKAMQSAAQVTELEVPAHSRVAWLRRNYSYFEDEHKDVLMAKLDALTRTSGKKVVDGWRALADQSRWDEFVAAMLSQHYDVVYARAQSKYLTPTANQNGTDADASNLAINGEHKGNLSSANSAMHGGSDSQDKDSAGQASQQEGANAVRDDTVEAASALSYLFSGARQKLIHQMGSKQAESTLRWHREPVLDITDEIYSALAAKILTQYDPAALS